MECNKRTWLIEKRKAAGYRSARQFAQMIGISPSYYQEIERGDKNPREEVVYRISKELDFKVGYFFEKNVHF